VIFLFCSVPAFSNTLKEDISLQLLLVSEEQTTNKLVSKNSFIVTESNSKTLKASGLFQALGQWGRSKKQAATNASRLESIDSKEYRVCGRILRNFRAYKG